MDDVLNAARLTDILIQEFVDEDLMYEKVPPMGHDIAMVFYLKVKVWEARTDLESDNLCLGSRHLKQVIGYLQEGLRHEPENTMLREQMKRREDELQIAKEFEVLMVMSDRVYKRGEYDPDPDKWRRGGFRGRGRGRGRGH